jgi:SAM-dependent methyltransferase
MLDYDREAEIYDETRGGVPRAMAAADAVLSLLPPTAATLVDVGCGTGIVTAHIARLDLRVFGADPSFGMARVAAGRLGPGLVALADGRALPYSDDSLDAASAIWLLHLVDDVPSLITEVARVLRRDGTFITTVDKDAAHDVGSDIDDVLRPYRRSHASDACTTIHEYARSRGLIAAGETTFTGHGQGRSPERAAHAIRRGYFASVFTLAPAERDALAADLDALPQPTQRRPDPSYRLVAFRKVG